MLKKRKKLRRERESILVNIILLALSLCCIIPLWLVISISFTSEQEVMTYGYQLMPKHFDLTAYQFILRNPKQLLNSYVITILSSFLGTALSVIVMILVAYPLARKNFVARRSVTFYLFFTMLFSGGLVPTYILITQYLHLNNSFWVYILPHLVSPWHVVLLRTFFQKQPEELIESAKIDGAGEYRILFQIIVPISGPVIATVALLGLLTRWNDWMTSLLYINKDNLVTLQYLLQKMMKDIQLITQNMDTLALDIDPSKLPNESARMAMAVLAAGPMLCVFPFFQKYFAKGLTVGAVKG